MGVQQQSYIYNSECLVVVCWLTGSCLGNHSKAHWHFICVVWSLAWPCGGIWKVSNDMKKRGEHSLASRSTDVDIISEPTSCYSSSSSVHIPHCYYHHHTWLDIIYFGELVWTIRVDCGEYNPADTTHTSVCKPYSSDTHTISPSPAANK